jgi:putative acetyltransferase
MSSSKSRKKRKSQIRIRGYEPADAPALAQVHQERSTVEGTLQLPYQSTDELTKRWSPGRDDLRVVVAEVDGHVVGVGSLHRNTRPRLSHSAAIGMCVAERARRRGVGKAILDAVLEIGEEWLGLVRIELTVFVDNAAALRLYRSRDFEIEGVLRAYGFRAGKLVDAFQMARVRPGLPWPRVTAEEVAQRVPPLLPAGPDRTKN